ncbi:Methyltransferase domain-containing protein [Novosphingobium sp. CF614]|uniref:methyltransferase domain-containing protein n=1 Tax=Novosphingobium sp. CF614 TaxID=1884364 RepID=UPI0008E33F8E|nr:methyltransferase domain-containing protein [Novosphingobium sp. CF614]SFG20077.1 Methyltransferase domain-containing protein [Novosphingobium sp. CF614]
MIGTMVRSRLKALLPRKLIDQLVLLELGAQAFRDVRGRHPRDCSICGYHGRFWAKGRQPMVFDGECPQCRSVGRHRQQELLVNRHPDWIEGARVLHFAPEPCFAQRYRQRIEATGGQYVRAAYVPRKGETQVDMQAIPFADNAFDTVIHHNVLEHVPDDRKALSEIARVLRPGGRTILTVPLVEAWERTYEDPSIETEEARDLHFNKNDHLRLYGRDFHDRLVGAGFDYTRYVAEEPEVSRYGLERGETIFIASPRK